MAEEKSRLDKIRDLYLPTVREYEKKLADTLSYYAGPELTKLGQGIFALRPFQNRPDATEFIQNPSLKTGLDLAGDTAITIAEATPFGYLASKGATLPGKVAQEVIKSGAKTGVKTVDGGKGSVIKYKKNKYIRRTDKIQKYNVMKDKVNDIYSNPSKYNLKEGEVTNVGVLKIVNKHLNDMGIDSSSESAVNRVLVKLRGVQKGSESNILKKSSRFFFNKIKKGEKVTSDAMPTVKFSTIFDDTGKTFSQTKSSFLNNNVAKTFINKTKNLFQDKSTQIFDVDHIQAPRFGGTNAESNLRLITKADHVSLKTLPTSKTLASDVVKAKSGFENEYYNLSTKLIDNIKNDNYVAADKIAESLRVLANNFKKTYKNVDFIVSQPHVAIKTGGNTAKYIKYGDDIKLSSKQKKYIEDNNLLPEQSNLPNAGKPIEKQAEDIYQGYLQIYNLLGEIPSESIGKVAGDIKSMDIPIPRDITVKKDFSGMRNGGLVGISHLIRPL